MSVEGLGKADVAKQLEQLVKKGETMPRQAVKEGGGAVMRAVHSQDVLGLVEQLVELVLRAPPACLWVSSCAWACLVRSLDWLLLPCRSTESEGQL